MHAKYSSESFKERKQLEDLGVDGIILKYILNKSDIRLSV
jgi:hypothetical protein